MREEEAEKGHVSMKWKRVVAMELFSSYMSWSNVGGTCYLRKLRSGKLTFRIWADKVGPSLEMRGPISASPSSVVVHQSFHLEFCRCSSSRRHSSTVDIYRN